MPRNTKGYFYQGRWWARVIYFDESGKRHVAQLEAKSEGGAKKHLGKLLHGIGQKPVQRIGSGTIGRDKNWYGRFDYTDSHGKRKTVRVRGRTKTDAESKLVEKIGTLRQYGTKPLEASQMTFDDLADYYTSHYLEPEPRSEGGEVPFGFRSVSTRKSALKALREYFGQMRLRTIDDEEIERFKNKRLRTPITTPKQKLIKKRTVASVNRELSLLRRLLNISRTKKWIMEVPSFKDKKHNPLISIADETKRQLFLTREQEQRLLDVCLSEGERVKDKAPHYDRLRQIIICAIDTGMRRGEILKLKWIDVDFENRFIEVRAHNTKTGTRREVPVSERLHVELQALYGKSSKDPEALCFGCRDNVKRSFDTVRKKAGLPEIRFHDLRHTHASRLMTNMSQAEVGRILGHTVPTTTYRYSNVNSETVSRARDVVNAFNEQRDRDSGLIN